MLQLEDGLWGGWERWGARVWGNETKGEGTKGGGTGVVMSVLFVRLEKI